ncbi:MAG: large extracellular alpha-helical protein, partial [Gammaproteobacteria bacterium]
DPVGVHVKPDPDIDTRVTVDELTPELAGDESIQRIWLVEPERSLPLDSEITLGHRAGLRSPLGDERGLDRTGVIGFHTFPEFRFLGVSCTNNSGEPILIAPDSMDITDPARMCDPLDQVALRFSTPLLTTEVARSIVFEPDLAGGRDDYDPWANAYDYYAYLGFAHQRGRTYNIPIPERLRAYQSYRVAQRDVDLGVVDTVRAWLGATTEADTTDVFGRPLVNPVDLEFWTNHRRPDFRLVHRDAVLEAAVDSEVPLYVTNLDQVRLDYVRLTPEGGSGNTTRTFDVPDAQDVSFAVPLGVRDLTGDGTGAVYGAIGSTPGVSKSPWQRRFFAQVTPYQVHAKAGHFNTLVWVTDLESGQAVAEARVAIYKDALSSLGPVPESAFTVTTDAAGIAMLPGIEALDPERKTFRWDCNEDACEKLMIR